MKKILKITIFAAFIFFLTASPDSRAAVKGVKLENNQKITKYDLNGDGKKDTLMIKGEEKGIGETDYHKWKILINGNVCLRGGRKKIYPPTYFEVTLYKVSSSRMYLFVEETGSNDSLIGMQALYQVKGNKLIKCIDFKTDKMGCRDSLVFGAQIDSLSSKKMAAKCGTPLGGLGSVSWYVIFNHKAGKWIQQGNSYKAKANLVNDNILTASQKVPLTAKPGGKKAAFSLRAGDKVKLLKVCIKNKHIYAQFSKGGKRGWFTCPKTSNDGQYFKEAAFAG